MAITLKNKDLRITVELPGEFYRGTRFDWNGTVVSILFRSHEVLGYEKPRFSRNPKHTGRGLHNEFGIHKPVGYDDCAPGDWFPKIGTGWLKKNNAPYAFHKSYDHEPLDFATNHPESNRLVFTAKSGERNGYGYVYTKTLELQEQGFTLFYELKNTGTKVIETNEYIHNFLKISPRVKSPRYHFEFPWTLKPELFSEINDPQSVFSVQGNRVELSKSNRNQYYLGGITAGLNPDTNDPLASWTFTDRKKNLTITETGDFVPSNGAIWGWTHVVSPELFCDINVSPLNTIQWMRRYSLG